jgi:hypothetical protein
MTCTLTDGIALASLSSAFIQEASLEETVENSKTYGMVSSKAQVVHLYEYGDCTKGNVKGRGALTLAAGIGGSIGVSSISGGVTLVPSVKYTEKLTDTAEWEYSFENYPHAS